MHPMVRWHQSTKSPQPLIAIFIKKPTRLYRFQVRQLSSLVVDVVSAAECRQNVIPLCMTLRFMFDPESSLLHNSSQSQQRMIPLTPKQCTPPPPSTGHTRYSTDWLFGLNTPLSHTKEAVIEGEEGLKSLAPPLYSPLGSLDKSIQSGG